MKHKLNLKLQRLKEQKIKDNYEQKEFFQPHCCDNKKICKTLHPISIENISTFRIKDTFEEINYEMAEKKKKFKIKERGF